MNKREVVRKSVNMPQGKRTFVYYVIKMSYQLTALTGNIHALGRKLKMLTGVEDAGYLIFPAVKPRLKSL